MISNESTDDEDFWDYDDDDGSDEPDSEVDHTENMVSLVHFRSSLKYLEADVLARVLSDAWGLHLDTDEESDSDGYVVGEDPLFFISLQRPTAAVFLVHNCDTNYFENPEEVASEIANLRFSKVVQEHDSWLSVDLMQPSFNQMSEEQGYQFIGKAISALADEDTEAIFCPQRGLFNIWSTELSKGLCTDQPLAAIEEEVQSPVFDMVGDDIDAAMNLAKQRWPEFVSCFHSREQDSEQTFLVKAAFEVSDEEIEHMWVEVFGLEPNYIHGYLLNQPLNSTKLSQGSQVEVAVDQVSDWFCVDENGKGLGNFTAEAIARRTSRKFGSEDTPDSQNEQNT